jgi:hypothetical protein
MAAQRRILPPLSIRADPSLRSELVSLLTKPLQKPRFRPQKPGQEYKKSQALRMTPLMRNQLENRYNVKKSLALNPLAGYLAPIASHTGTSCY